MFANVGAWGEMIADEDMIARGYAPVHSGRTTAIDNPGAGIGSNGIDHIFVDPVFGGRPPIIADSKTGGATLGIIKLGNGLFATQLSNQWVRRHIGSATGSSRQLQNFIRDADRIVLDVANDGAVRGFVVRFEEFTAVKTDGEYFG